ncbi:MAG: DegT/DnrJ/EryC1/StrS family aminotransferase [Candidatus Woesearchaeota archaeon]
MTRIPFLDLQAQLKPIREKVLSAMTRVMDSGRYVMGPEVELFEEEVASYLGVKHAIGVASGSDALLLSLMALDVGPGDEVITSPFTFFATAGSIVRLGATPVFVDIDEQTYNLDPELVEKAITSKTKAIMPVHIFGQPCDMSRITAVAERHGLKVVEDACQAIGAEWKGKKAGTIGDLGCFSFFPTKNLGGMGDGGLVVTNNDAYAGYLRKARLHGAEKKYHHQFVGINSRLDALQAAVLRVKLKYLDGWNDGRKKVAEAYDEAFKGRFVTPVVVDGARHVYHQYALLAKDTSEREEVMARLKEAGVASGIYYPVPLHLQECFSELGYEKGSLPVAEDVSTRVFSLPIYPEVDVEAVKGSL